MAFSLPLLALRRSRKKVRQLARLVKGHRSCLVIIQLNPDPDAIASAAALRYILQGKWKVRTVIAYSGVVGRSENRAMVRYLNLPMVRVEEVPPGRFDLSLMVDTQPGTGNNAWEPGLTVHGVIDHHPQTEWSRRLLFSDIRSRYGATSTILTEYLVALRLEISSSIATALLYGIRSDTQDLGRQATGADIRAYSLLVPLANKKLLSRIENERVPPEYFQLLVRAVENARVYGEKVVTDLKAVNNPDMVAEVADILLRLEGMDWSLCQGVYADTLFISLRTSDVTGDASVVARSLADGMGRGGGHHVMAGAQMDLKGLSRREREDVSRLVRKRFLEFFNLENKRGRKLLDLGK